MARYNMTYRNQKIRWKLYSAFEKAQKRRFLSNLSERDGVRILRELHACASHLNREPGSMALREGKIDALVRVHSLFSKVTL